MTAIMCCKAWSWQFTQGRRWGFVSRIGQGYIIACHCHMLLPLSVPMHSFDCQAATTPIACADTMKVLGVGIHTQSPHNSPGKALPSSEKSPPTLQRLCLRCASIPPQRQRQGEPPSHRIPWEGPFAWGLPPGISSALCCTPHDCYGGLSLCFHESCSSPLRAVVWREQICACRARCEHCRMPQACVLACVGACCAGYWPYCAIMCCCWASSWSFMWATPSGRSRVNQGCRWMSAMVMRFSGSATKMHSSRCLHSGDTCLFVRQLVVHAEYALHSQHTPQNSSSKLPSGLLTQE